MEKLLYGLLYVISIPLWILYMCVDIIDKELLKKRRNYIAVQEILSLGAGILIISEYKEKKWVVLAVITAGLILLFLYDFIRRGFRYLLKIIKFLLFPFYYVIRHKNIKKMDKKLYKDATGDDLDLEDDEDWENYEDTDEDLRIEQNELKKVNSNSIFETDTEKVITILTADNISLKNAMYIFGFRKVADITADDLKIRYRYLAKRFHSDNAKEDECIMQGINVAHDKLLNFAKKS